MVIGIEYDEIIKYGKMLDEIEIDDYSSRYYNENPVKKSEVIDKHNRLKEEIVSSHMNSCYKEGLLKRIDKSLNNLNLEKYKSDRIGNTYNLLHLMLLGGIIGFLGRGVFDNKVSGLKDEIARKTALQIYKDSFHQ